MGFEGKLISLYNYNGHKVYVKTHMKPQGVAITAYENNMPGVERFSFDEIRTINQTSGVIRNGELKIEPEYESEVFQALGIYDISDNDWTPEEILDAVLKPTKTKLEAIKKITSPVTLDAFLSVISAEEIRKEHLIVNDVREVVEARRGELLLNKQKSEIKVVEKSTPPKTTSRESRVKKTK